MDAPQPPPSSSGNGGPPGKQQQGAAAPGQPLVEVFGGDMYPAALVLVLLLLGLMSSAMTRCVC
jgi:hypothetical protein